MNRRGEGQINLPAEVVAAAHELKAPLALIRQLALALEAGPDGAEEASRLGSRIALTSERALRLVSDLTRASRTQANLFELEPVNPDELCEEVARELAPLFSAHGKSIRVRRNRQHLLAVANRDLLRRVLVNFSDNALHYAGADSAVELSASARGGVVRIGVRDYGPAIAVSAWRNLSATLGRSAQPLSNRPSSSGLGLYLAGQFAERMNGRIGLIRHRDGATFYVDVQASAQLSLL